MNKLPTLPIAITVVCLAALTSPTLAQPTPEQYDRIRSTLAEADANGDGRVTRREFDQHRAASFERLDRNADAVIDNRDSPRIPMARNKFTAAFNQAAGIYDKNSDGRITRSEWDHPPRDVFASIDKDNDGVIVLAELPKSL